MIRMKKGISLLLTLAMLLGVLAGVPVIARAEGAPYSIKNNEYNEYDDLIDAVSAADADTIVLMRDVDERVSPYCKIARNVVYLDLNGHTGSYVVPYSEMQPRNTLFYCDEAAELIIEDNSGVQGAISCDGTLVFARQHSRIGFFDGRFECDTLANVTSDSEISIASGMFECGTLADVSSFGASILITGGTFECGTLADVSSSSASISISGGTFDCDTLANVDSGSSISISGGTFDCDTLFNASPDAEIRITGGRFNQDVSAWIPDGYYQTGPDADGFYTVRVAPNFMIGSVGYDSLQDAIDAAQDGDTIVLMRNVSEDFSDNLFYELRYSVNKPVTIDLNGHSYSIRGVYVTFYCVGAALTICDSSGGRGSVACDGRLIEALAASQITITGGAFDCSTLIDASSDAQISITGGRFTQDVSAWVADRYYLTAPDAQGYRTVLFAIPTVGAHSLTLGGDIGVNFYADIPRVTDTAYAQFTVDGVTTQVPVDPENYELSGETKLYKFTCSVAAAQIDTPIIGKIVNGDTESEEFAYSVQDYLTEAQQTMADKAEFMALAGSLATYGYYANALFAYNPDFTQHALFDDSGFANVTVVSLINYAAQITNMRTGVTYAGSSLVMRTETAIKHYFTLPAGKTLDDYTILLGEGDTAVELTPKANGSYYYVEIPDIPSAELGDALTVRVLDGDGSTVNVWRYSALSYVFRALMNYEANDPAVSDALANAVKALTLYYQAADAYFSRNPA